MTEFATAWTDAPPAGPGYYWMLQPLGRPEVVRVRVLPAGRGRDPDPNTGQLAVTFPGSACRRLVRNCAGCRWAGPVPRPETA